MKTITEHNTKVAEILAHIALVRGIIKLDLPVVVVYGMVINQNDLKNRICNFFGVWDCRDLGVATTDGGYRLHLKVLDNYLKEKEEMLNKSFISVLK